jgi:hypothetical protein
MEGTVLRTLIAGVLISGLTYGAASAKAISPDLDRQITISDVSSMRTVTGLNPNRKLYNGQKQDRRRAYVSIHHFDTT